MNKYIIFAFDRWYPSGGMKDLKAHFETTEEVKAWIKQNKYDNYEVVHRDTWAILDDFGVDF